MKNLFLLWLGISTFLSIGYSQNLVSNSSFERSTDAKKYVMIIVEGVNSSQNAHNIDSFIRTQSGVSISRMDYRTKLYFGIYDSSSRITLDDYKGWFTDLGYKVKCSNTGIIGQDRITRLKASDCDKKQIIQKPNLQKN